MRVDTGLDVPDICREVGSTTTTFYKRKAKYGGMDVSMISLIKEREKVNHLLNKRYLKKKLKD